MNQDALDNLVTIIKGGYVHNPQFKKEFLLSLKSKSQNDGFYLLCESIIDSLNEKEEAKKGDKKVTIIKKTSVELNVIV